MKHQLLRVRQLWTQNPVVELLWEVRRNKCWPNPWCLLNVEIIILTRLKEPICFHLEMNKTNVPTARQNWSTWTAPSCLRKFMKRKRRSCCSRISFSSSFSTWWTKNKQFMITYPDIFLYFFLKFVFFIKYCFFLKWFHTASNKSLGANSKHSHQKGFYQWMILLRAFCCEDQSTFVETEPWLK